MSQRDRVLLQTYEPVLALQHKNEISLENLESIPNYFLTHMVYQLLQEDKTPCFRLNHSRGWEKLPFSGSWDCTATLTNPVTRWECKYTMWRGTLTTPSSIPWTRTSEPQLDCVEKGSTSAKINDWAAPVSLKMRICLCSVSNSEKETVPSNTNGSKVGSIESIDSEEWVRTKATLLCEFCAFLWFLRCNIGHTAIRCLFSWQ